MGTTGALQASNPGRIKRDNTLALMRADGKTYAEIEKVLGLSKGRIGQLVNHDENVKAMIEDASKIQVSMLPAAMQAHAECIKSDDDKIRLQAAKLTYQNTGIAPSHTQPRIINNILVQQQSIYDPVVMDVLRKHLWGEDKAICVTPDSEDG